MRPSPVLIIENRFVIVANLFPALGKTWRKLDGTALAKQRLLQGIRARLGAKLDEIAPHDQKGC